MTNFEGFLRRVIAKSLRSQFLWKTKKARCTYLILETEIVQKRWQEGGRGIRKGREERRK